MGENVGSPVGEAVGAEEGTGVGLPGVYVGAKVGTPDGDAVGADVGAGVGVPAMMIAEVVTVIAEELVIPEIWALAIYCATALVTTVVKSES